MKRFIAVLAVVSSISAFAGEPPVGSGTAPVEKKSASSTGLLLRGTGSGTLGTRGMGTGTGPEGALGTGASTKSAKVKTSTTAPVGTK